MFRSILLCSELNVIKENIPRQEKGMRYSLLLDIVIQKFSQTYNLYVLFKPHTNIRCTVQYNAIKPIIADNGYTILVRYQGFLPKGKMSNINTVVITVI